MLWGISSNRSCRFHHPDRWVDVGASPTEHVSPAFSLFCAAASRGRCCHTNCAAVQDDVLATATRLAKRRRWDLIHFALLDWLARQNQIDWTRAVVDSCSVRALCDGSQTGPNPADRTKRGSKRHMICDGQGVPLAVRLTGANRHDSKEALPQVDAILPLQGLNTDRLDHPPKG